MAVTAYHPSAKGQKMGKFGSLQTSEEPFRVELVDPVSGKVITDKAGKAAYVDVLAADGVNGRKYDKAQRAAGVAGATDPDDQFEKNAAKCAALTVGWYLVDPDTQEQIDVQFTPQTAKEFYLLPATNWFAQVWLRALNNANFMKRSAKNSTSSQSGNSETAEDTKTAPQS